MASSKWIAPPPGEMAAIRRAAGTEEGDVGVGAENRGTFETERTNVGSVMEERNKEMESPERDEYANPGADRRV